MTKYILHGGRAKEDNSDNDNFYREMTLDSKGKTIILLNFFSREDDEIQQFAELVKERFIKTSMNKDLEFEIAQPESFIEQLKRAHVMYIVGGRTEKLTEQLSNIPNLPKLFDGKVIAGSSAGTYTLTKYYWENDNDRIEEGLGIFNFKAFCHYESTKNASLEQLKNYKEDLPILVLPNYKWVTLYR